MSNLVRPLWDEPRAADPPPPCTRDWVLVTALVATAILEGTLRSDVIWRPVALILAVALAFLLPWRRTQPLLTLGAAFGCVIAIDVASVMAGVELVGLDTMAYLLIVVYSLLRWGSGREIAGGVVLVAIAAVFGSVLDAEDAGEVVGGIVVLVIPMALGIAFRYRSTARVQELTQVKSLEREQLARELHDTVAHHVSAIAIRAQAGRTLAPIDPGAALDALVVIEAEASRALGEMRAMVRVLRRDGEADLSPQRGIADIARLADDPEDRLEVSVHVDPQLGDLAPSLDAAVYRMAQESLTNARRHAHAASCVDVTISADPSTIRLRVHDDGARSHVDDHTLAGYGLIGMSERAELLGGSCHAGPDPAGGWTVSAELPRHGSSS